MSSITHPFMGKVFVGNPTVIGTLLDKYERVMMAGEVVEMEFKGVRDGMLFTSRRIVVINSQGIMGRKVEVTSFPWKSIAAYSVENAGTIDFDAEMKICGSGWGVCEVQLGRGADVQAVCQYINRKIFPE
ncbi:PH domain-containing protein [Sphingomonas sp. CFBP 8764]|uniref:PH domain-containing protein n=1 Tax=Sphingomonas sp. CFBP 8764 TaxID=2775275 RepID=UPI0017853030|nr:PH domain-containing protein [Sphingomonas sp. CFBP 8764]MBD8552371.1 PH domain-containing protein [Sphingomonas sp. CFBP 8764]